jgi:hypothetical protein
MWSERDATTGTQARLLLPWLVMAIASVVVPWAIYLTVMDGTVSYAISPVSLWSLTWPLLIGGVMAVGLRRFGSGLPHVPDGDIAEAVTKGATRLARTVGVTLERLDSVLRQWPVAGIWLMILTVVLTGLLAARR